MFVFLLINLAQPDTMVADNLTRDQCMEAIVQYMVEEPNMALGIPNCVEEN